MGEDSKFQKKNEYTGSVEIFFRTIWTVITLPIGYVFAAFFILTSKRSSRGYWNDLKGSLGRVLASEWGDAVIFALILALFIRSFIIQAFKIPSGSMRMTLIEGDRLMVNKLRYGPKVPFTKDKRLPGFTEPKRGDVIVFIYPADPSRDFIKRLIGLGGDSVEIKEGNIYVNGNIIEDPVIKDNFYYNRGEYGKEGESITIPEGQYFVLGDNSGSSSDGRFWGYVPEENVIGRAELIYWPFNRMRFIK